MATHDSIEIDVDPLRGTGERALRVLDRFAGFEILGRIAIGGMIELLLARERSALGRGRLLALRVMRARFAKDPALVDAFARESRAALRLEHPNLCRAHRAGIEDGVPFLALELVHGTSLRELIARAGQKGDVLAPQVAAGIAAIVADVLHRCHVARERAGTTPSGAHQDLTTDDVIVAMDGTVKLLATPRDARSDVFALGIVLHEMLTGKRPSSRALARQPRLWPAAVPDGLRVVLDRALADDGRERYPTAAAMLEDLERFLAGEHAAITPSRIAEAVVALGEGASPARAELARESFVALRGRDATGTQALRLGRETGSRSWPKILFAVLLALAIAGGVAAASAGIAF